MKKRSLAFSSGMLWSLEAKKTKVGIFFGTSGGPDTTTLQKIRSVTKKLDISATWEAILHPALLLNFLYMEAKEFEGWNESELHERFSRWAGQMKQGKTPRLDDLRESLGVPASEGSYIPRKKDEERLKTALLEGGSHLLVAPRRTGKTSLMRYLSRTWEGENKALYVNLEDASPDPEITFFSKLMDGTGANENEIFALLQRSSAPQNADEKKIFLTDGMDRVLARLAEQHFRVLMLDEITIFFDHFSTRQDLAKMKAQEKEEFQKSLRGFLGLLFETCQAKGITLLLSGSFALDRYLEEHLPQDALQDLQWKERFQGKRHSLSPLEEEDARPLWRSLLMNVGLIPTPSDLDWFLTNVDFVLPYHAKVWLVSLADGWELMKSHDQKETPLQEIEEHLDAFLKKGQAFADYNNQLHRFYAKHRGNKGDPRTLLDRICREPSNSPQTNEVQEKFGNDVAPIILSDIFDSFPVQEKEGRLVCVSKLFRRWWSLTKKGRS